MHKQIIIIFTLVIILANQTLIALTSSSHFYSGVRSETITVGQRYKLYINQNIDFFTDFESYMNSFNETSFNPSRISSNDGCHIIYDFDNCKDNKCLKKIVVNNKNIKNINYDDAPNFYYFPEKISKDAFSSINFLKNNLNIKQTPISNLNQIRSFLKEKNNIIHGVGCIQNIYPRQFKLRSMNQCKPTAFIIDNIIEENKNIYLSIRTSIDDLHSPRLIHWSFIYNSLKTYQNVHSINSWTLYGLQKNN